MFSEVRLPDGSILEYLEVGLDTGIPVVFHHGSPGTSGAAVLLADAARRHGVRLIAISRPGYGGSSAIPPGLAAVGHQTVALMDALGVDAFGVFGASGGGPYALATAVVGPDRVTRVVVAAGPAPDLADRVEDPDLTRLASGDVEGAAAAMTADVQAQIDATRELDDDAYRELMMSQGPPGGGHFADRPADAAIFFADLRRGMATPAGLVRDNLSWGASWDVDPAAITVPVVLVYGETDGMVPPENGTLLAGLVPGAELTVLPDAGHGSVTFGTGDLVLGLLAADAL